MSFIDLTRREDGNLNDVSLVSKVDRVKPILPDYLQEVNLGAGIRACYFKEGVPEIPDFLYYDLAWLKIPAGFQYIPYTVVNNNSVQVTEIPASQAPSDDLLIPVLRFYEDDRVDANNHICTLGPGGTNGCSTQACSIKVTSRSIKIQKTPLFPFYLFKYSGKLRTTISLPVFKTFQIVEEDNGDHYLMLLFLSDRTAVYYAFKKENENTFNALYNNAIQFDYAEVDAPLTMNDELGIFVTNSIKWLNF